MLTVFWDQERARASERRRRPQALYPPPQKSPANQQEWLNKVKQLPDVRQDKVLAIRQALEEGKYDLEENLIALLDRMPGHLAELASRDNQDQNNDDEEDRHSFST